MTESIFRALGEAYDPTRVLTDEQRRAHLRGLRPADLLVATAMQAGQAASLYQLKEAGLEHPLLEELLRLVAHGAGLLEAECKRRGLPPLMQSGPTH